MTIHSKKRFRMDFIGTGVVKILNSLGLLNGPDIKIWEPSLKDVPNRYVYYNNEGLFDLNMK